MIQFSEIIAKKWLIQPDYARAWYPTLLNMATGTIQGEKPDFSAERFKSKPYLLAPTTSAQAIRVENGLEDIAKAPQNSVLVVPISGPVMKEDSLSRWGTATKATWLEQAYQANNIAGIVLDLNSGGGEVDGTMSFGSLIKQRNKPVVSYVNSMAASAAYWIAMYADEIMLSDPTAQVGSIGVMMTFVDDQEYWSKMGIKWVEIVADGSKDKNKGYFDAKKGDYKTIKNESLNPLREMFADAVVDARGAKIDLQSENVLTGKMYFGSTTGAGNKSAIAVGLADKIGNMNDAISRVLALATSSKYKNKQLY